MSPFHTTQLQASAARSAPTRPGMRLLGREGGTYVSVFRLSAPAHTPSGNAQDCTSGPGPGQFVEMPRIGVSSRISRNRIGSLPVHPPRANGPLARTVTPRSEHRNELAKPRYTPLRPGAGVETCPRHGNHFVA